MKILSNKDYTAAMEAVRQQSAEELKGYYTQSSEGINEYLAIIARQTRNALEFAQLGALDRMAIKSQYETNGAVFGVVDYIARNIAEVSPYLELINKRTDKVDEAHPLNAVLARPNDRYTFRKFIYGWAVNKLLFGDAWVYAPKSVGKERGIREMYIIPSQRVAAKHGDYERMFEGIVINGRKIDGADVFESFDYNLDDTSFFGTSKIAAAALYLSVLEKGMQREATSLQNGGVANLITPANSNLPALPADKDSAEQELNSRKNFNKSLFVRMPIEVHTLGNTPVDLNILASHKEAVTALCFVYGIPVDLYYGQSKYENAKEAKKSIYEQAAIPMLHEFGADLLNYAGLSMDYELRVNTDKIDALQSDPYQVAKDMAQVGAFTTNEIREQLGWEARPEAWANEVRVPLGVSFGAEPIDFSEE